MKRMINVLTILVLLVTTIAGCSSKPTTVSVPELNISETPTPQPEITSEPQQSNDSDIVEEVNGYKRFKMTRTEFVERYKENLSPNTVLAENTASTSHLPEDEFGSYMDYVVAHATALNDGTIVAYHEIYLKVIVDKEDKIIAAQIIRDPEKTLGTDEANNAFIYEDSVNLYKALIKGSNDDEILEEVEQVMQTGKVSHGSWNFFMNKVNSVNPAWGIMVDIGVNGL